MSEANLVNGGAVFITGATGGIGLQLAKRYAKRGKSLVLWGRNEEKLKAIAKDCRALGAQNVYTRSIDLTNSDEILDAFMDDQAQCPCGCVILCAGLSDMRRPGEVIEDPQASLKTALVNFSSTVALATAAAKNMVRWHIKGEIVLIGSVAGFYEIPFATIYSSSKAGVAFFAKSAQLAWKKWGISVVLISPGFVDTAMSQKLQRTRPFLVPVEKAADKILKAIDEKKKNYIFPWPFRVLRIAERVLPDFVREKIIMSLKEG